MIEKMTDRIADALVDKGWIEDRYKVVYKTGVDVLVSAGIQFLFIIALGILTDDVILVLLFMMCFSMVREYSGGYHAPNRFLCFFTMGIVYVTVWGASIVIERMDIEVMAVVFILIFNISVFWMKVPATNTAKKICAEDITRFRKIAWMVLLGWEVAAGVMVFFNVLRAVQISCVLGGVSGLILPCEKVE